MGYFDGCLFAHQPTVNICCSLHSLRRRHGHLSTAQVQAAALLEEARARSAKSDSCEVALRSQRRMTEDSIRRITAAITDSLQKMAQSVRMPSCTFFANLSFSSLNILCVYDLCSV